MPSRICPHCGFEEVSGRALTRHVRTCPDNPDPTCPKCGGHFATWKVQGHIARCRGAAEAEPAEEPAPEPSPPAASPAAAPALEEVPADRLTPLDKLITPLMAPPTEKPAAPAKPKRAPRSRAKSAQPEVPAPDPQPSPEAQRGGMVGAFEERPPPRLGVFAGLGESIKRNWVLLLVIAAALVALIAWRRMSRDDPPQGPVPPAPAQPTLRPPYNPELHGTLEQYRASYGHLPTSGGA